MILNTFTHELIYLDPFHPNAELAQAEKETAWLFGSWVVADIPSMDPGKVTVLDQFLTQLPRQTDTVSCGVYISLYMLMFAKGTYKATLSENIWNYRWRLLKCFLDQTMDEFLAEFTQS